METGKFSDNLRVQENGLLFGVDRVFKSSNSTFQNIGDRLNPHGKSVDFDILFLGPPSGILFTCVHDDVKILVPWKWYRFAVFRAFAQKISQFLVTDNIEITCHYMTTWTVWKFRITTGTRCGVLGKTMYMEVYLLQNCVVVENIGSNWTGIAIRNTWRLLVSKSMKEFYFGLIFDSICCLEQNWTNKNILFSS